MSTVLLNHYIYKGTEYHDVDQVIQLLNRDGINITKGQIPSNVDWQKSFWAQHNVEWFQSEKERDIKKLAGIQFEGLRAIEQMFDKVKSVGLYVQTVDRRIPYGTMNEINIIYYGIDATESHSTDQQFAITDSLMLTKNQTQQLIKQVSKQYSELLQYRNNTIRQLRQAPTVTAAKTVADQFISYCNNLIG